MVVLNNKSIKPEIPVKIREMNVSDVDSLMKLKNAEGWNQTVNDWRLLIDYKESVRLTAIQENRIIGSVTAINYANTIAWIGMLLVDKDQRGRGISKLLLNEALDKLKNCESIKLDATPEGKPVYLKKGFKVESTLYRMTSLSVPKLPMIAGPVEALQMTPGHIPEITEFDARVFGADRTELISFLYGTYPELARIIIEHNRVTGFCLGRKGENYTQIGPVYASTESGAKALIRSAIHQMGGQAVVVDIHAGKSRIIEWLKSCGFSSQRSFERMYLHNNPHPGIIDCQYLIAGPELG